MNGSALGMGKGQKRYRNEKVWSNANSMEEKGNWKGGPAKGNLPKRRTCQPRVVEIGTGLKASKGTRGEIWVKRGKGGVSQGEGVRWGASPVSRARREKDCGCLLI